MDTEKVCRQCGTHCVPAQSYCFKCGSMLPAATPGTPTLDPPCRPHKLILNRGVEERILECEGEEQALDEAMPWVMKGYIARIADEHGVVRWTQALSEGPPSEVRINQFKGDATGRRPI